MEFKNFYEFMELSMFEVYKWLKDPKVKFFKF